MDQISVFLNLEALEPAKTFLLGNEANLYFLCILMLIDIVTGVVKAFRMNTIWSRKGWYGYARKMGVFMVIILAIIIDLILNLNGVLATATIYFYLANEGLSIIENLNQIGVPFPKFLKDRLLVMRADADKDTERLK
ncbi:phage holin family protein [Shouchella miscanthi]|uniref:phage holin family protein n=1 Tax=Shouchella miscanthi TaxID=2598861 RepID=UPI00119ED998|nr:phage holin family protein [Shouchella miscanthi]